MGKALATLGFGATGAAAATGAVYLSRMGNFDSSIPDKWSSDEFEKSEKLEGCISSTFQGLESMKPTATATEEKVEDNFLGTENKKNTEGCLVINWNRDDYGEESNRKWKGGFRFLWSAKHTTSNKGFVVFAVADPVDNSKKFKWTGAAYTLEKKEEEAKWIVTRKLEIKTDSASGKDVDFKDKFPKPKIVETKDWGFGDDNDDKLCGNGECSTGKKQETTFEGYWTWTGGDGEDNKQELGGWSDKLGDWWKETFGESTWNMKEVVKEMKGKWSEKVSYKEVRLAQS